MNKAQAIHQFWNSFSIPAYDESTVSPDIELPRITYEYAEDNLDNVVFLSGSLWYKGMSWQAISDKAEEIAAYIDNGLIISIDNGYIYITRGTPFAQRMSDENNQIRRIYINIQVEFLTQI